VNCPICEGSGLTESGWQSKNATENDVRRHFEQFGPLERVRVVRDKKNRSRGYAFLVYERERDMKGKSIEVGDGLMY